MSDDVVLIHVKSTNVVTITVVTMNRCIISAPITAHIIEV